MGNPEFQHTAEQPKQGSWRALYVKSRAEKKVFSRLNQAQLEVFLPLRKVKKQWSDRLKDQDEVLLKGYLFVRFGHEKEKELALQDPYVVGLVKYLGEEAEIPHREIDILRVIAEKGYHVEQVEQLELSIDKLVEISEGVFKGFKAKILRVKNGKVAYLLLLEGTKQCIKVKVPVEVLRVER
ncbi:MAG: UpxY family transcription antiterminator [Luteibaculaceae bacterium]